MDAPLCGQRAVRADVLRGLDPVARFGLEVAMTIDAVRAGARLAEVEVPMDHRRTGRSLQGFAHRGRQGADVLEALWPRVTSSRARIVGVVLIALVVCGGLVWTGASRVPASVPSRTGAERVVLVGVPHMGLDDVGTGAMPTLDGLVHPGCGRGHQRAHVVRPAVERRGLRDAWAGTWVRDGHAGLGTASAQALPTSAPYEGGTAGSVLSRRAGWATRGEIVVPATPVVVRSAGEHLSSAPGALGDALTGAGRSTAVVNNADKRDRRRRAGPLSARGDGRHRRLGAVGTGEVEPDELLVADLAEPYGLRADVAGYLSATADALKRADLVVVDLGDMNRAAWHARVASPEVAEGDRRRALGRVDEYLAGLVPQLDRNTLLLVVGVRPPGGEWDLTPTIAYGAGVVRGSLHSPSTKREGLVTLTDIAPTVLEALGVDRPAGMIGNPLRYRSEPFDMGAPSGSTTSPAAARTSTTRWR